MTEKLFAGAWNVFVGSSHEDDTANSISGGYDGLDDLRCGWSWLFIYYRDFATVSGTKTFGFSVIDNSFWRRLLPGFLDGRWNNNFVIAAVNVSIEPV